MEDLKGLANEQKHNTSLIINIKLTPLRPGHYRQGVMQKVKTPLTQTNFCFPRQLELAGLLYYTVWGAYNLSEKIV